ncbi:MAG: SulP family inorganic anion transporter [Flavobacterium sp.]
MTKNTSLFANLRSDFASGLVVFLVALPLCLGIALASGAPPLSGIIAGIIGGIVVGSLSRSHISVTGPAAGLTSIVFAAITQKLGTFELFLLAVFIGGILQLVMGFIKAGSISNYFPANVIEGMLAGIGVIIIITQLEHAVGYDKDYEGDEQFFRLDGTNPFSDLPAIMERFEGGAIIIALVSLAILIAWDKIPALKRLKLIPGALVAVAVGIGLNELFKATGRFALQPEHLVKLPELRSFADFSNVLITPDFAGIGNTQVWITGATIAVVASIETLLCIEASDRMDVQKRYTDTNIELKAQGLGNVLSSLIGGLPMTSVVVRSSANAAAGARSKMSTIIHGLLLLVCVLAIPMVLNLIPLATLAAVLLMVGYKLASPSKLKHFWAKGKYQFIPFIITLVVVVAFGLLYGVAAGMFISIIFIMRGNLKRAYNFRKEEYSKGDVIHIDLAQEVSFLNKAAIKATLNEIPENSKVIINASDTVYIAHDVLELIEEFRDVRAKEENIEVILIGFKDAYELENTGDYVSIEHTAEEDDKTDLNYYKKIQPRNRGKNS